MINLERLLKVCVQGGASDLHLVVGSAPALRVEGKIVRVKTKELDGSQIKKICYSVLTDTQRSHFENKKEIDFSFGIKGIARFRVNYFYQRGQISAVFRKVPLSVPSFQSLNLPSVVGGMTRLANGLVLVTGPTGSGKTTTIASLIDKINSERRGHIITLEDPIEFLHQHKKCIVNQREIGMDTSGFQEALKYVVRQDPDVCLVGEMRDPETIESALSLAETGHLVFATLHTNSAPQTINRIVGVFPSGKRERVSQQLSLVLQGVISQRLLSGLKRGRVVACEYLQMNSSMRTLIRENKIHQIYGQMQVGQLKSGMMTLNQSLAQLVLEKKVDIRRAFQVSSDVDELEKLLRRGVV